MEQTIKQVNGVRPRAVAVELGTMQKYRALVIRLLGQLKGGFITLIEGDTQQQFGERSASLSAQINVLDP